MQRLLGGYAFYFNRRHGRHGHLFGGRFTASLVDDDPYAVEVCAYVGPGEGALSRACRRHRATSKTGSG